jgi:tetratricopeptide (TPR) repeat protein
VGASGEAIQRRELAPWRLHQQSPRIQGGTASRRIANRSATDARGAGGAGGNLRSGGDAVRGSRAGGTRRTLRPREALRAGTPNRAVAERAAVAGSRTGGRGGRQTRGGLRRVGSGRGALASATVPSLASAQRVGRGGGRVRGAGRAQAGLYRAGRRGYGHGGYGYGGYAGLHYRGAHRHHGHHHSHYRHGFYGHYAYPYGFSFGIHLGGYGYSYGHGSYPYYSSLHVGFPYVGYYHRYSYAYFSPYGYEDCGYYSTGYYLRYGPYRRSYFSTCSGLGAHAYAHHHHHREPCSVHGAHYYHARDCNLCDPGGSSYAYHEVDVPSDDTGEQVAVVDGARVRTLGPAATDRLGTDSPGADSASSDELFSNLKPAQLSVTFGLNSFKSGDYERATEEFYNASIEDPESPLVKVLLGMALFSTGEYRYAAGYFRRGLGEWPDFARYTWQIQNLYGELGDFQKHSDLVTQQLELTPTDEDTLLVSALTRYFAEDFESAGPQFAMLRTFARDTTTKTIAEAYLPEVASRIQGGNGAQEVGIAPVAYRVPLSEDDPVGAFLRRPGVDRVGALPIR